ncbi:ras-related protein Rab-7a [Astyanax mexicanus]|uniref:ras-related protein Rab-7a n=1 Tax=Astyanax mexicanus TaxID=7994 RepID=UPI0020CA9FD0|nr:ras-related protein Rab-7a [Astyanax mexicanus]
MRGLSDMMGDWTKPHLKLVLVGNSGVGKTSLMTRFVDHRFTNMYRATIGVDFLTKELTVDKNTVILQLWDTAGSERFFSLGSALYRGAHCCLLVFDLGSDSSFRALDGWISEVLLQTDPADPAERGTFPFIVVGNKTDLQTRQVCSERVQQWCEGLGAEYFECSAKENTAVDSAFITAARAALRTFKHSAVDQTNNIQITDKDQEQHPNYRESKCSC